MGLSCRHCARLLQLLTLALRLVCLISLSQAIESTIDMVRESANFKKLEIKVVIDKMAPKLVLSDVTRFRQVSGLELLCRYCAPAPAPNTRTASCVSLFQGPYEFAIQRDQIHPKRLRSCDS